ncbi:MAG: family 16 glycosylhydrolase [Thermoleophilaceae bacterium]|nr:family 16 glycosylhydrolase [Thermoleophilaceae bacterium]
MLASVLAIFAPGASAGVAEEGVTVSSPRSGATISDVVVIKAQVGSALARRTRVVQVWLGKKRVAVDGRAPYHFKVDTTKLEDGDYRFRVKAVLRKSRKGGASRSYSYSQLIKVIVANGRTKSGSKAPSKPEPPAPVPTQPSPLIPEILSGADGWTQIFGDEFSGTQLDRTKFNDQRDDWIKGGTAYSNLEDDFYMPANTTVSSGNLVQTIRKQRALDGSNYTTGMVNTNKRFSFKYGYVEARMRVPACDGCWPAFWMLPSQVGWPPEIDIFEFFDSDTDKHAYLSTHWGTQADHRYQSAWSSDRLLTDEWHTYGMLWNEIGVQSFIDGVAGPTFTGDAVPHEAMYLIIQQALGKGHNTPDGVSLLTDYVRVYQQQPAG